MPERANPSTSSLRSRWLSGDTTLGGWCFIPSPFSAEIMASAGFDWVCVDAQHGMIGIDQMLHMLRALAAARTPALVRVDGNNPARIGKALDAGATGVIVPMVNTAADAERVVQACRYAPRGTRSWASSTPAGVSRPGYNPVDADDTTLAIIQIETTQGVENLNDILSVDGIDGIFVGPGDLTVSLDGNPREQLTPKVREVIETVAATCTAAGMVTGIACSSVEVAVEWRALGYTALAIQGDVRFLSQAARQTIAAFTEAVSGA